MSKKQISLKTTVLTLFLLVTLLLGSIFAIQLYFFSQKLSFESINIKVDGLIEATKVSLTNQESINKNIIKLLDISNSSKKELYTSILESNRGIYALYTGYSDGSFYEIINLDIHKSLRTIYKALPTDRWLLVEIDGKNMDKKRISFLDKNLNITASKIEENSYDPRKRPWFIAAKDSSGVIKTKPYQFSNIPTQGITYALNDKDRGEVVAIDVLLYDVREIFKKSINNTYTEAYLFDKNKIIISSLNNNTLLEKFFSKNVNLKEFIAPKIVDIDGVKYIAQIKPLGIDGSEYIALFATYDDVLKPYEQQLLKLMVVFVLSILVIIPLIIYFSNIIVKPIYKLIAQSKKIQDRNFKSVEAVKTSVKEVSELSASMIDMSKAIESYQSSLEEKVRQRTKELSAKNRELEKLSITDKLTGLYNRVKLDSSIDEQYNLATRYNTPFSLILLDIDHFKQVNDIYGHKIGDDVLIEVAKVLLENIRTTDVVGRWGGEEFLIICKQSKQSQAELLAHKINKAIASHKFSTYEKQVTISIGVCGHTKELDVEKMLIFADEALYRAKQNGRNRVEVHN